MPSLALTATLGVLAVGPPDALAQEVELERDVTDEDTVRVVEAVRIEEGEIQIDGVLDEAAWERAPAGTNFIQHEPESGSPSTERTEVRVLYSTLALYVGVRAYDSEPERIRGELARRDRRVQADEIAVYLDTYHDRRTAFMFSVNPRGSIRDVYYFGDSEWRSDASWDPVWQVQTSVDSLGWTAEFRIPMTQLRFDENTTTWGLQVHRRIHRNAELAYWAPYPRDAGTFVSLFGRLEGLTGLSQPRRLEIRPYTLLSARWRPESSGALYAPSERYAADLGFDLQYGITSDFTLDLTVNPDFGQVEADPAVVNLTAFETFFPERRPFFVEGVGLFQHNTSVGQLFYSRRIGRSPQGFAAPPPDGTVQMPERTTILGAAKLSGKTAGGLGFGVLSALTSAGHAVVRDAQDAVVDGRLVEPRTHYLATRLEQDFREGEHTVGAFLTAVHRNVSEEVDFLHDEAYSLMVDGLHQFDPGGYQVSWYFTASRVSGSESALLRTQRSSHHYFQRPDADHLFLDPTRTSLSGVGFGLQGRRQRGRWQPWFGYAYAGPGLNYNDAGFQWRGADRQDLNFGLDYVQSGSTWIFQNFRIGPAFTGTGTTGGELLSTWFRPVFIHGTFKNNWSFGFNPVAVQPQNRVVTALRGGPSVRGDLWRQHFAWINTDQRKRVSARFWTRVGGVDGPAARWHDVDLSVDVRPNDATTLTLSSAYSWRHDPRQWVGHRTAAGEDHYILGEIEQRTLSLTARLNWTLTPRFSFEFYGQPFASAGSYERFRHVVDPMARSFDDRLHLYGDELSCVDGSCTVDATGDGTADFSFGQPDFNVRHIRSTAVARWEFQPGSVAYLVWQQDRNAFEPNGDFGGFGDLGSLLDDPADHTVMLKVTYWFGF